jgi:histone-lysine N-methyltransferase SETMAR
MWNADNGVVLLHDNARPHAAVRSRALLEYFNWELLDHPPYNPHLTSNDYHLFSRTYLKNWLRSELLKTNVVLEGDKIWLSSQATEFFDTGIQKRIP